MPAGGDNCWAFPVAYQHHALGTRLGLGLALFQELLLEASLHWPEIKAESPFFHHIPALLPSLVDILDSSGSESQNTSVGEVHTCFSAALLWFGLYRN